MAKGWLKVPGLRPEGDRTLAEQTKGLSFAVAEAKGKRVLDLGCAEGLIGREFALAGAVEVVGLELLAGHLEIARKACADAPQMVFVQTDLAKWAEDHPEPERYDIVLALSIIQKLRDPNVAMLFAARSSSDLVVFRGPSWASGGRVKSKFGSDICDVPALMAAEGFAREREEAGGRPGENVVYWRRK